MQYDEEGFKEECDCRTFTSGRKSEEPSDVAASIRSETIAEAEG